MLRPEQIFDGHNDAVTRYTSSDDDWVFIERSPNGHLDLVRGREGGFLGGFFAIFPGIEPGTWFPRGKHFHTDGESFRVDLAPELPTSVAFDCSERMFDRLDATGRDSEGRFAVVRTAAELDEALQSGAMAAVAHFEGAEALGADLEHFDHFYERGLRSIGPVWSRANAFGTGVPFAYPGSPDVGPGLTEAGRRLVHQCDERRLVVDLAHMNEAGFWDVAGITSRPLVVTHTGAHSLCEKPRNLTDKQIDAVGESGGVIGITFFTGDLTPSVDPEGDASTARIAAHVRYIAERIGVQHVALGSDFDGAPIPRDMGDAAGLPLLVTRLKEAGFDGDELAHITHGNWLRVLRQTLA